MAQKLVADVKACPGNRHLRAQQAKSPRLDLGSPWRSPRLVLGFGSSMQGVQGQVGPLDGRPNWNLVAADRDEVFQATGCTPVYRARQQWGIGRKLVITGPLNRLQEARAQSSRAQSPRAKSPRAKSPRAQSPVTGAREPGTQSSEPRGP